MAAVLFYTIGLPGAGKTTFAQGLAKQLNIDHIYGDKIGYELFTHPKFTPEEVAMVRSEMQRRVAQGLRANKSVVYDAMLHTSSMRKALVDFAASHGKEAVGVWVQTPESTARQRAGVVRVANFSRDYKRIVPPAVFDKHLQLFEPPTKLEQTITVWGTATFAMQYASVRKQLLDMKVYPWG